MSLENTNTAARPPLQISGVYPHLCAYSVEPGESADRLDETGIGAIVPWGGRLYMITYGAHYTQGSTHKLYSIGPDMQQAIHPESVGGTPAGRMIHRESRQLLIGPYLIDAAGKVRVIAPETMPGRITAIARHLEKAETMVYYVDMEGMVYEADVYSLKVRLLFRKAVPGWHAKGAYTAQGRLVMSNNGEHGVHEAAQDFQVADAEPHPENAGVLAQWDGREWELIERRQYTEVTGPGGIHGAPDGASPLWSVGWDRRSLRLKLLDNGAWHTFLLPKAAHNNDPRHGWFTEWPRIREIGEGRMMMDMHGMFYRFPAAFSAGNTAGIAPISSHLRYIPDFCEWEGRLLLATDEASVMGHAHCGQPQSNLWFGSVGDLEKWGPRSGYGGPWVKDAVKAAVWSDPLLVAGFDRRVLHLAATPAARLTIQLDPDGAGNWQAWQAIDVTGYAALAVPPDLKAEWIRLCADRDCVVTAYLHGTDARLQAGNPVLFQGVACVGQDASGGLLYPARETRGLELVGHDGECCFTVSRAFAFEPVPRNRELAGTLEIGKVFDIDAASVIVTDGHARYRLPKGDAAFDRPFCFGWPRALRELESERNLANIHGTFYEVPRSGYKVDPDWERMRPVSSHRRQIHDYCTWQGLLVLSGVAAGAAEDGHVFRGARGGAIWCGAIDDLWQLGKPAGSGGPWKDSAVKAGVASDAYLMTGYDRKTLSLKADRDATITMEINVDHQSGWHASQCFVLRAGQDSTHVFPEYFSAHWVRFTADQDCRATAWLVYA